MPPELPTRPPRRTAETAPFWDGCASGKVVLPRCTACGELIWYPRHLCPACGATDVEWTELSGAGTVYSYTVVRKGSGPYREVGPYVVAIVELAEGPRVMTNVVTDDVESVSVGMTVVARFDAAGDGGDAVLRFEPA